MTYSSTKFEVATSNGLGGDTFTRNVTDGRIHARTDSRAGGLTLTRNYTLFSKENAGKLNHEWRNGGNTCYHVAAFVFPFNLICNMTMF